MVNENEKYWLYDGRMFNLEDQKAIFEMVLSYCSDEALFCETGS